MRYRKSPPDSPVQAYPFEVAVACGYVPGPGYHLPWWKVWFNRLRLRLFKGKAKFPEIKRRPTSLDIGHETQEHVTYNSLPKTDIAARRESIRLLQVMRADSIRRGVPTDNLDNLAELIRKSEKSWKAGPVSPMESLIDPSIFQKVKKSLESNDMPEVQPPTEPQPSSSEADEGPKAD